MAVDLRSDTVTRPTPGMRGAIAGAEVGDDVYGEDPTVRALEDRGAALSGKAAALFVPSGTMGNQIGLALWTRPGDAMILEQGAHVVLYEAGAGAAISGVHLLPVAGDGRGHLRVDDVEAAIPPDDVHKAPARLLGLEDTSNRGGGTVYDLDRLDALAALARSRGLRVHLDGARIFNAAVASGTSVERRAQGADTLTFCLSKGLGAPVGSVLCGPIDAIAEARRIRKRLGGGMRQAGLLAAAGLYALDHHVERLAEDHRRARELALGLLELGLPVQPVETNMVYVDVPDAAVARDGLRERGVLCNPVAKGRLRLVTHLDVDDQGLAAVLAAFRALFSR